MDTQTQQSPEGSAPSPILPPGAARPTTPRSSSPEVADMDINIGNSFWDMTESEMQALELNVMDLCRVKDNGSSWPAVHCSPASSPILWFVPRNYLEAPRGCLPEDPFSAQGEYLVSPNTSPDASSPPDLPMHSAPMTDACAAPFVTSSRSYSPSVQDDADSLPASPVYTDKAKVRLDYIDNALGAEQCYEIYSSTGERDFWEMSRLAMKERVYSERDWREWMGEGTCGYYVGQGF